MLLFVLRVNVAKVVSTFTTKTMNFLFVVLAILVGIAVFLYQKSQPVLTVNPRGKAILITGAAGGLGSDLTFKLLEMGSNVIACDISLSALERTFSKAKSDKLFLMVMDVTDKTSIEQGVEKTEEQLQKWNISHLFALVNNAGIAHTREISAMKAMVEMPDSEMVGIFGVNIFGVVRCTNAFYPLMKHHFNKTNVSDDDSAIIVNIASMAGRIAGPYFSYYTATKFAVVGYSDSLRRELAYAGVRVTCIEPGFTATPIVEIFKADPNSAFTLDADKKWTAYRKRSVEPMMKPSQVSAGITSAIFASRQTTPAHIQIDSWGKWFMHQLMIYLPYRYSDALLHALE
jgi:NAD(P)-dependent dehydrogenase (short-subunit alcohol dehydrogenase family)